MSKTLLKSLGHETPQARDGVFQIVDMDSIKSVISGMVRESHEDIDEKIETMRQELYDRIEDTKAELEASLFSFGTESDELRQSLDSMHSIRKQDAKDWADMLSKIQGKVEKISSKGELSLTDTEKKIRDDMEKSVVVLQRSLSRLENKSKDVLSTHQGMISEHREKYEREVLSINSKFKSLEEIIGKIPKDIYEFGYQLQVSNAGNLVGITSLINFKSGFTVVANGLGIDITASGAGFTKLTTSSTIDNSNTVFVFTDTPTYLVINGAWYDNTAGDTYTWTGTSTVTLNIPVGSNGRIWGFK